MIISHTDIAPDTLYALIEEFVTRDGTDYGDIETSTATKVQQVMNQLESKDV
ncbi:MAG: YheU family protein, partial [Gammaproteobacteria bacterium]|nr:YheU family protein [Gammaproteobacteria bacterium]